MSRDGRRFPQGWQVKKPKIFQYRNGEKNTWVGLIPVRAGESFIFGEFRDWEHARDFVVKNYYKQRLVPGLLQAPDMDTMQMVCSLCDGPVRPEEEALVCIECDSRWDTDGENGEQGWRWLNRFNRGEPEESDND